MALSGSVTTSSSEGRSVTLNWTASQSITNNTSTVSWSLVGSGSFSGWVQVNEIRVTINGSQQYYRSSSNHTQCYNGTQLASGSLTISHAADGTKSFSITVEAGIYQWAINCSGSGSFTLNTIPRASSISSVTSSVTVDGSNSVTVNISRNSTAFTHKVKFAFGSYSQEYTGVATSKSYTPPMTWLNAIPNATSGTATVTVTTYNGSTQIGSAVSKNFTVNVPSSVVPTLGTFSATIVNNTVPSSWGIYVQDKSQCKLQISNASGAYSSTIKAYSIKQGSTTLSTSSSVTTPVLAVTGGITYTATITDSRGRTASKTVSIQVYAYVPPSVTSALSQRCLQNGTLNDNGTYIKATGKFSFASCNGKNSATAKVYFKKPEDASWSTGVAFSSNVPVVIAGSASIDSSYQVMYEVTDAFTTVQFIDMLSTAFTTMDFKKGGKGVAIGKVSEYDNLFDVGMPSKFHEGLVLVDEHGTEYDVLQILKNLLN